MHLDSEDKIMNKRLNKFLVLLIVAISAASCKSADLSPEDAAFNKIIPLDGMNSKLKFIPLDSKDDPYRIGKSISIGLKNLSESKIIFPSDYGLQLFINNDGQWKKVDNLGQYIPEGNTQISPMSPDTPGQTAIGFYPDLKNQGQPIQIRVVIQGILYEGETSTDEKAGAYIDIMLQP